MTSPENIGAQFTDRTIKYIRHEDHKTGETMHAFQMRDAVGNLLGHFNMDNTGHIVQIETHPEVRRQGVATALYNAAKAASQNDSSIPAPRHSSTRTPSGNAWAKAVSKAEGNPVAPLTDLGRISQQRYAMHGAMWEMMLPLKKGE